MPTFTIINGGKSEQHTSRISEPARVAAIAAQKALLNSVLAESDQQVRTEIIACFHMLMTDVVIDAYAVNQFRTFATDAAPLARANLADLLRATQDALMAELMTFKKPPHADHIKELQS